MAEFKLGRLRFVWKGSWTTTTAYVKDDVVRFGGKTYVCLVGHTASANFYTDLNNATPRWSLMADGIAWAGTWTQTTAYKIGDLVRNGGQTYIAVTAHTSTTSFAADIANWNLLSGGFSWRSTWAQATLYNVNDVVLFGSITYICIVAHTSSSNFATDENSKWQIFVQGTKFIDTWNISTQYSAGDVVTYGGYTYVAKQTNTGQVPSTSSANWAIYTTGFSNQGTFTYGTQYYVGHVVQYGGNTYVAILDNVNQYPTNATYWSVVAYGIKVNGPYSSGTTYNINDVVTYGGNAYRALQTTTGNAPSGLAPNWQILASGLVNQGIWSGSTNYKVNDLVSYGANVYIAIQDGVGQNPSTAGSFWSVFSYGYNYAGTWSSATAYKIGQVVTYGGSLYQASQDGTNQNPSTASSFWTKISSGVRNRGTWTTATSYAVDEIVTRGANLYISLLAHTSTTFSSDLSSSRWQLLANGLQWRGDWVQLTTYLVNDLVASPTGSIYVATQDHTAGTDLATDITAGKWTLFIAYSATVLPALPAPAAGKSLTVSGDGSTLAWINASGSTNILYVGPGGTDGTNYGKSLATPYASIKYACSQATSGFTIFVKSGTYSEQLPITVPAGVSVVGDSMRTVFVQPAGGLSDDSVTPNNEATMFRLSNSSALLEMTFQNMTGWVPGSTPADISTSTPKGVYVAFNASSPITTRAPNVNRCAVINTTGGVGAYLDGSLHASGTRAITFTLFSITSNDGVGIWAANNARPELQSCATNYCYFGFAATGGARLRSDSSKNSWGTYGVISQGFLSSETSVTGNISGQQLNFIYNTGSITVGDTVTSITSGGTAIVRGVQLTQNKVFVSNVTGSFNLNDVLLFTSGGSGTVTTGSVTNQTGNTFLLTNLTANPVAGGSITIGSDSYVIQAVSGTYTNTSSRITVTLVTTTVTTYANNVAVTIRYKTSVCRVTGHDFLNIGTGNTTNTNYPGDPLSGPIQANEISELLPGRVFYATLNEQGNYKIGNYFNVNQLTGIATLNPAAFSLTGISTLQLGAIGTLSGATITKFSTDGTLISNSDLSVPTEQAVKTYVDNARTQVLEPTGYNLNNTSTMGVMEISNDGTNIIRIDQNGVTTSRSDGKFATGTVYETTASARRFVVYPASGQTSFSVWTSGIQRVYTTLQSVTYSSLNNLNYFFFNGSGVLVNYTVAQLQDSFWLTHALTAICTGTDSSNTFALFSSKRIGINMPGSVQFYLAQGSGAIYRSGFGVTGVSANALTYTNTLSGTTQIQDITHSYQTLTTNAWLYNLGGLWTVATADNNFAFRPSGTTQFNGSGALTNLTSGQFTVTYFIATSDKLRGGVMKVIGQRVFTSLAAARQSAQSEPRDTVLTGLPFNDFVWIGAVVVDSTGAVQTLDNGLTYIDLRYQIINAGVNALGNYLVNTAAADIYYNNATSGLSATNVQAAIDASATSLKTARSVLSLNTLWTNAW